jgi:hypothetical protein
MSLSQNKKKQEKNLTNARDKKCEPMAEEIVKMFGQYNLSADNKGDVKKNLENYGPLASAINGIMKERGFTIGEANYTWTVVQSIIDSVRNFSVQAMQSAFDIAEEKLFKVDSKYNITLQEIDNVLQS